MIKNKRLYSALCLCMCTAFCLAGCGKRQGKDDDPAVIDVINTAVPAVTDTVATEAATDAPATDDPNLTPAPTEVPELPAGQVLWLNTMPTDLYGVSMDEAEAWFSDAVFIGDSITLGWKNYNDVMLTVTGGENFFGQTHFLCEGSYGAGHALEPVSANSLHPVYMGEQRPIWESIQMMQAKKAFICFGLNDIAIYGVDGTVENFGKVCDKIKEYNPDCRIYIISAMYMYKGSEMTKLNNPNLRALNEGLRGLCKERGMQFVDIASHLVDTDGYLLQQYSSDKYVHQTSEAYNIWADILRSIAAHNIVWGY